VVERCVNGSATEAAGRKSRYRRFNSARIHLRGDAPGSEAKNNLWRGETGTLEADFFQVFDWTTNHAQISWFSRVIASQAIKKGDRLRIL
jgi:hypothetical protein